MTQKAIRACIEFINIFVLVFKDLGWSLFSSLFKVIMFLFVLNKSFQIFTSKKNFPHFHISSPVHEISEKRLFLEWKVLMDVIG